MKFPFVILTRARYHDIIQENEELQQELAEARKNDNRDPVTGKFISQHLGSFVNENDNN